PALRAAHRAGLQSMRRVLDVADVLPRRPGGGRGAAAALARALLLPRRGPGVRPPPDPLRPAPGRSASEACAHARRRLGAPRLLVAQAPRRRPRRGGEPAPPSP